jgi:hypothetical protein
MGWLWEPLLGGRNPSNPQCAMRQCRIVRLLYDIIHFSTWQLAMPHMDICCQLPAGRAWWLMGGKPRQTAAVHGHGHGAACGMGPHPHGARGCMGPHRAARRVHLTSELNAPAVASDQWRQNAAPYFFY